VPSKRFLMSLRGSKQIIKYAAKNGKKSGFQEEGRGVIERRIKMTNEDIIKFSVMRGESKLEVAYYRNISELGIFGIKKHFKKKYNTLGVDVFIDMIDENTFQNETNSSPNKS